MLWAEEKLLTSKMEATMLSDSSRVKLRLNFVVVTSYLHADAHGSCSGQ